ncbi:hypothetical protein MTO96_027572 [Rhipicephalus appendiculatus]
MSHLEKYEFNESLLDEVQKESVIWDITSQQYKSPATERSGMTWCRNSSGMQRLLAISSVRCNENRAKAYQTLRDMFPQEMTTVDIGSGVMVEQLQLDNLTRGCPGNPGKFSRGLLRILFSPEELKGKSLFGKKCNAKKEQEAREGLDPVRVKAVIVLERGTNATMSAQSMQLPSELIISLVRYEPALWDQRTAVYRNADVRADAWKRVVRSLGLAETHENIKLVSNRWRNLRDTFAKKIRELKKKSGAGVSDVVPKWKYFDHLLFLKDIIEPRPSTMATATKKQLVDELRVRGLRCSGRKDELIARLIRDNTTRQALEPTDSSTKDQAAYDDDNDRQAHLETLSADNARLRAELNRLCRFTPKPGPA